MASDGIEAAAPRHFLRGESTEPGIRNFVKPKNLKVNPKFRRVQRTSLFSGERRAEFLAKTSLAVYAAPLEFHYPTR
ncbi:hypothetical protein K0M31_003919 [Melipona bicolor]|uniref:Uncharacterized protein n=1 Tax=Melipona bicolor TaxID=60889 RepID=A0AA40KNY3_9HYME|nr:hypothetical protein K0M31_003919 [Melipona bicolor]